MTEPEPLFLLFKLAGGSPFIIAEVFGETINELKTRFPLVFSFSGDGNEVVVNASRWMPFAERDEVIFDKRNIYGMATPKQSIIQYYLSWRNDAPPGIFEHVEGQMLEAAFDPTLDEDYAELYALDETTATRH